MGRQYDVLVIGGGHAGVEAAWAAARLGAATALVTMDPAALGRMSCNPAIGGLGKGQIVREIDALGGLMGLAIDQAGIHFRMLNRRKGPAVWAPRAQADRAAYSQAVRDLLRRADNLRIVTGVVRSLTTTTAASTITATAANRPDDVTGPRSLVDGVILEDGTILRAAAVVVASGTFLRGLMHCGEEQNAGGRFGEPAAVGLSASLEELGFELARLKTGTPARLHRDSLDYAALEVQNGDPQIVPFSFLTPRIECHQVCCWITYTTPATHDLIRQNLHRAPMYTGQIRSRGPRYCPSIEDKVVRFADRPRHQIFLEPEGRTSDRIYCNGISTSLPRDVQEAMLRTISGLERARILQYGYAVEYDFVPTGQITATLETRRIGGLFLAGQINGTSGYEEAAGQGLLAGINAAQRVAGRDPVVLGRDQAYIGVMIDDLITRPAAEPYRMFTSRAEYRLSLRADNADQRLTPLGRAIGLVDDERWRIFQAKAGQIAALREVVGRTRHGGIRLSDLLKQPDREAGAFRGVLADLGVGEFGDDVIEQVLIDGRYAGYLARQERQVTRFREMESMKITPHADYASMVGLRTEAREKLTAVKPATIGQAARIPGVNPADVAIIWVYLSGRK